MEPGPLADALPHAGQPLASNGHAPPAAALKGRLGSGAGGGLAGRWGAPAKILAERLLRWSFCLLLLLILVPSGSVNFVPFHRLSVCLFTVAALALLLRPPGQTVRAPYALAIGAAIVLAFWIVLQSLPAAGNPLAHPLWGEAVRLQGAMPQAISVAYGDSLTGLVSALLPFAVFLTALVLCPTDAAALALIRILVLSGLGICLFGLAQFWLYPDMLVFDEKRFYLQSLTTVFVNHNTAATYIGMMLVFSTGLALHALQNAGWQSFVAFIVSGHSRTTRADGLWFIGLGTASIATFVALMLTQSRAGIAASLLALALLLAITLSADRTGLASGQGGLASARARNRLFKAALAFGAVAALGFLFAGLAILRARVGGTSDLRFCFFPRVADLAADNWLTGTGFGTFRDVYPAYRNPACGMDGVLFMAHNFYLEGIISLGLPFVVLCLGAIALLVRYFVAGIRSRRQFGWVPAAGLSVLVLQVVHNTVDFSIQNPGVAAVFAALTGASVAVARGRLAAQAGAGAPSAFLPKAVRVTRRPARSPAPDRSAALQHS